MKEINDGGPAFPRSGSDYVPAQEGMSLRDWFAGQVLAGLVSDGERYEDRFFEDVAAQCYEMADEMIQARSANE